MFISNYANNYLMLPRIIRAHYLVLLFKQLKPILINQLVVIEIRRITMLKLCPYEIDSFFFQIKIN